MASLLIEGHPLGPHRRHMKEQRGRTRSSIEHKRDWAQRGMIRLFGEIRDVEHIGDNLLFFMKWNPVGHGAVSHLFAGFSGRSNLTLYCDLPRNQTKLPRLGHPWKCQDGAQTLEALDIASNP